MSDLAKVKAANIAGSAVFWIAVMVVYLQARGLSLPQIYSLIAIYYGSVVVLEFPTGALGDHFSHRLTAGTGYIVTAVLFLALGFPGGYWYYLSAMLVGALGMTLTSGNDTACLHALSPNFRRDQSQVKFWIAVVQVATTALGSLLIKVNPGLPFWANGAFLLVAACFMFSIRHIPQERASGNPVATAVRALRYAASHPVVRRVLLLAGTAGAFFLSVKWFFNPMLQGLHVPLPLWGTLIGLTLIAPLLGIMYYRRQHADPPLWQPVSLFALTVVPLGLTAVGWWPLAALYACMVIYGYLDTALSVRLNAAIQVAERASILSLSSLFQRLGTSIYTPIAGTVLGQTSLANVMLGSALLLAVLMIPPALKLYTVPGASYN
jgi:MFS family permease